MIPETAILAPLLSQIARDELLPRFSKVDTRRKQDGSLVTAADFAVQERLQTALAELTPDAPLLGEEMTSQQQDALLEGFAGTGLWCLDPLDGTSNFAAGIPFFCISLAFIQDHRPVLGIVYDPVREECFSAALTERPAINGVTIPCAEDRGGELDTAIAVVDFKRLPRHLASQLATAPPYRSQRNFGSVALEWCWLAADRHQLYVHGRQNLWDYAAGAFIFSQTAGCAETLHGAPLFNPALQTTSAMAATHTSTFRQWKDWLLRQDPSDSRTSE